MDFSCIEDKLKDMSDEEILKGIARMQVHAPPIPSIERIKKLATAEIDRRRESE